MGRLHKIFAKDTLFSPEKRLCFFAGTPTPGTPAAPEVADPNAARIAELEAELAPLKANASRTAPENARMAGIEAELAVLRTPPAAATPPQVPDSETAGEQKTIDDLRKAAAEAETRSADPKPFYQQGHIPLDHLDTILAKMADEKKMNPEIEGFDEETVRVFHELKRDLQDYDFVLDKIKNLDDAMAKVTEDKREEFLQTMQKKAYAKRRLDETDKKLSRTPAGAERDKLLLEQKQFQDSFAVEENKLAAINTHMKTGPANPEDLERKAEEVRKQMAIIGTKLGWDQDEWGARQKLLWATYKDYFITLRYKISREREKAMRTILDKIDTVLVNRLNKERDKWTNCKPELESKKEGALKMINDALNDLKGLQEFERLPADDREARLADWKALVDRTFKISEAQEQQLKGMIGRQWSNEQHDEAVKRRTELRSKEIARCDKLKAEGKMTEQQYNEATTKENAFHEEQLKRFAHLRDHGWTQADCDEAIRIETEEQKRQAIAEMGMDPLKMRESMAQSIKSHEQSTVLENAPKEEQEEALGVTDEELEKAIIQLNGNYTVFGELEPGVKEQIIQVTKDVGPEGNWFNLLDMADGKLAALPGTKISDFERAGYVEKLAKRRESITMTADGMPFVAALQSFGADYDRTMVEIGMEIDQLKNKSLSPQAKKTLKDKIEKDLEHAKAMVQKFQDFLKENTQFFSTGLPGFITDVDSLLNAEGKSVLIGWRNTQILDINALVEIWKKAKEYVKHRYDRKTKERIGIVGEKMFQYSLPILGRGLGQEFRGTKEAAEREIVETEKKNLTNADAWEIRHHMHLAGNKDVLKGMIELLADRGRLRFDDPFLWEQLNKYQKKIYFNVNSPTEEMKDYLRLEAKIQKAMGYIWEFEFFNNMKRNNDSKYASKKSEYEKKCDAMAEQPGGLGADLERMLAEWDSDESAKHVEHGLDVHTGAAENMAKGCDPHLYEEIIEYAIQKGKMTPEEKVFYLLQGVARGLLSYERIFYFDSKYLNDYAILEVFASSTKRSRRPVMEDFIEWSKMIVETKSEDDDPYKPGAKFLKWFWTYAMHQEKCIQRINKVLGSTGGVDHDDVTPLAPFVNEEVIDKLTVRQGNRPILPPTGLENITVGLENYIEVLAVYKDDLAGGSGQAYTQMKRWIRSFVRYDAITDGRMYGKDSGGRERLKAGGNNQPRSNGYYHHGKQGWTVRRYLEEMRAILYMVDPKLADAVLDSNSKLRTQEQRQAILDYLVREYGADVIKKDPAASGGTLREVKDVDDFFVNVGAYIENIIDSPKKGGQKFIEETVFESIRQNVLNKNGDVLKPQFALSFTADKYDQRTKHLRTAARDGTDKNTVALSRSKAPTEEAHAHH